MADLKLKQRIDNIVSRIDNDAVRLIGVTKKKDATIIQEAYEFGLRDFGESYVNEFLTKQKSVSKPDVTWHFIGHLQRNKVTDVIPIAKFIHSVDSIRLVDEIEKNAVLLRLHANVLLEVNISNDPNKHGFSDHELTACLEHLYQCPHIALCGLMTIPKLTNDPSETRNYFKKMRLILEKSVQSHGNLFKAHELSMGMSDDFEIAIEEGATMVRIGTGIFGER